MLLTVSSLLLSFGVTNAFISPASKMSTRVELPSSFSLIETSLNLFGGGGKDNSGPKQPGMMDQLAMFKKAQEIASKKRQLDEELQKMVFEATSSNGNVKVTMKYVPVTNPMDPNPEYESTKFDFNDEYFAAVSADELAEDVKNAIMNGIQSVNQKVAEKYATLQSDLMEALGGKMPGLK
jgi:DNA-binding protein YbaB